MLTDECVRDGLRDGARVLIVDFGHAVDSSRRTVTRVVPRLATIPYGAPEIYGGEYYDSRNSERCDAWSLGALICCMVSGEHWPDEISDLRSTKRIGLDDIPRIVEAKRLPIDLASRLSNLGIQVGATEKRLAGIVSSCTSFDPSCRPPLVAVIDELEGVVGSDCAVAAGVQSVTPCVERGHELPLAPDDAPELQPRDNEFGRMSL